VADAAAGSLAILADAASLRGPSPFAVVLADDPEIEAQWAAAEAELAATNSVVADTSSTQGMCFVVLP
jgi:hypothetical protein